MDWDKIIQNSIDVAIGGLCAWQIVAVPLMVLAVVCGFV